MRHGGLGRAGHPACGPGLGGTGLPPLAPGLRNIRLHLSALVDDVARTAFMVELPIGILTSFIGVPFFMFIFKSGVNKGATHDPGKGC